MVRKMVGTVPREDKWKLRALPTDNYRQPIWDRFASGELGSLKRGFARPQPKQHSARLHGSGQARLLKAKRIQRKCFYKSCHVWFSFKGGGRKPLGR
jgi:hypothetical protein